MKWLVPFLFISSSFACVDLTGVYKTCERVSGSSTHINDGGFTIYKPVSDGVEFNINGRTFVADGNSRRELPEDSGNDTDLILMHSCDEENFTQVMTDPADANLEITYNMSKRESALIIKVTAKAPYNHINDLFVCD